jgi:hypothetical protein
MMLTGNPLASPILREKKGCAVVRGKRVVVADGKALAAEFERRRILQEEVPRLGWKRLNRVVLT